MDIAEHGFVVCTPGLVCRAENVPTCSARVAVFWAQVHFTRVTRLCVHITGNSVTNIAFYPISLTDIVAASGACFEMVSTERFDTQVTRIRVCWADDIVTLRAGSGVVSTDDVIADTALSTVSPTDFVAARLTRSQVLCPEGICTNLTLVAMGLTEFVAATGTVDSMVATDGFTTGATCGRIGLTDGAVTCRTRV